ncbi:MAG: hypothetical protein Q9220_002166 [cf. Caloplaca sp. 1 TL-2023]
MPAATEVHIPAWKKLGLKLKSASESSPSVPSPPSLEKRKREDVELRTDDTQFKPAKKTKKNPQPEINHDVDTPEALALPTTSTPPDKPAKRPRKSVSFTQETKIDDGESAKELYDSWVFSQKREDPSFDPLAYKQDSLKSIKPSPATVRRSSSIDQDVNDPSTISTTDLQSKFSHPASVPPQQQSKKKSKKKKKRNKSKSTLLSSTSTSTSPHPSSSSTTTTTNPPSTPPTTTNQTHPSLTYLNLHHTSSPNWKFSKRHSTHLLRHAFSLSQIPAPNTPALVAYISTLQSSSARQRIVEQAKQIEAEDEEWLAAESADFKDLHLLLDEGEEEVDVGTMDPQSRKQLFKRAVREHKTFLENMDAGEKAMRWMERVERRRRADAVLEGLEREVRVLEDVRMGKAGAGVGGWGMGAAGYGNYMRGNGVGGGIGNQMRGNHIRFGDAATPTTAPGNKAGPEQQPMAKAKGKRKRKRRTTGVPDDDSSSSSSSSSSDSDSEEEGGGGRMAVKKAKLSSSSSLGEKELPRLNGQKTMQNGNGNGKVVVDLTGLPDDETTSDSDSE